MKNAIFVHIATALRLPLVNPQVLVLGTALLTSPGVLGCQADVKPEETHIIAEETPEAKQELMKLGFPEPEGDKAPSALVPKACAVLQKQVAKISAVLQPFQAATSLTEFQTKNLILARFGLFGFSSAKILEPRSACSKQ